MADKGKDAELKVREEEDGGRSEMKGDTAEPKTRGVKVRQTQRGGKWDMVGQAGGRNHTQD